MTGWALAASAAMLLAGGPALAEVYRDPAAPLEARVEDLFGRLTLDEKISLLAGASPMALNGVPRLGVPPLKMTDGPTGVRSPDGEKATVFPVGVAIAATWDPDLAGEVGAAIARETQALGAQVLLAPTVNIVRTPRWGRNFETYSEDPFLAGAMGAGYVRGVQAEGVGTSLKHFAANNQETNRFVVSADLDERTLHEIYLPAFETVVREARPWSVMASYNKINGTYASEDRGLLTGVLKDRWAYDGVVVSDWGAVRATAPSANAGLDLEMPGPPKHFGTKLKAAVDAGQVSAAQIDDNARRVVRMIVRSGLLDGEPAPKGELGSARHKAVARKAAAEAMVLLKNDGVLPLTRVRKLAVIGPNAAVARIQGGGSSAVNPLEVVTPLEALREALPRTAITYAQGVDSEDVPPLAPAALFSPGEDRGEPGLTASYFASRDVSAAPVRTATETTFQKRVSGAIAGPEAASFGALRWEGRFWPPRSGRYEFSVRGTGEATLALDGKVVLDKNLKPTWDKRDVTGLPTARRTVAVELEAGRSYPIRLDYLASRTPYEALTLGVREPRPSIAEAVAAAKAADAAVVFVGSASTTEGEGYDRDDLALPGGQDELVAAVLAANPRTVVVVNAGAAMTMPWIDQAPAVIDAWLPGQEGPRALADVLIGKVNPSGRLPVSFPKRSEDDPALPNFPGGASAKYAEGLLVGYRAFERRGVTPLFPFGHGLSYTRFDYSALRAPSAAVAGTPVEVELTLRNTGGRAGKEVVQLYVQPKAAPPDEPLKTLQAFRKVEVPAGASRQVRLTLPARAFSAYDPAAKAWTVRPGAYRLLAGASSADIRASAELELQVR